MLWPPSGQLHSIPESRGAVRLRWKRLPSDAAGLTLPWHLYCLMRACVYLRPPASGGVTCSMPRTEQVLCTSSAPKTDQAGEGAYVVVTPDTLTALKQLRQDSEAWSDDESVFGLSMSQISRRVDSMARAAGLGEGYSGHSGRVGLAIRMTRRGAPLQAVQTHGRWKSPSMPARYTRSEKALEALEWLV